MTAKRCRVVVKRILLNGRVIEQADSQLGWKGRDILNERFARQEIESGTRIFVDVCASDELRPGLQVKSLREAEGYPPHKDTGLYTFEISVLGEMPCKRDTVFLAVRYDGRWDRLEVVSVKHLPWWRRLI